MKKFYIISLACIFAGSTRAQLAITAIGTPVTIDFTGFAGAGFQPGGGAGMLNSDLWSATGFSEGDVAFGATATTGDFARGSTMGFVSTGGIYGVDIAGNQGLMVQPVSDDFTPGSFILKLINNTPSEIGSIDLSYVIYVLNDQMRSNSFNFSYSFDNITYYDVPALDYASPEAADLTPYVTNESTTLSGLTIAAGDQFYFRWSGDDVSGTLSRDEFAFDDIIITAHAFVPTPVVQFTTSTVTVNESDPTADFVLAVTETTDCSANISLAGGTATEGTDFNYSIPDPVVFTAGGPTAISLSVGIIEDLLDEADESVIIQIDAVSGTCVLGPASTETITIVDNDVTPPDAYHPHDIAEVTTEDVEGVADSTGILVELTGIVYGINLIDGGLEFTLIDNTGGISVFNFSNDFGYTVAEGDELIVDGVIDQYNGLTEVVADTVMFVSAGNSLKTPVESTVLSEATESDFIHMDLSGYYFVDETQWLGDGTSFNVDVSNGTNTVTIRIDDNSELSTMPFASLFSPGVSGWPTFSFSLIGIGNQYDASAPFTEGYEVLPRYASDLSATWEGIQNFVPAQINIYPDPAISEINFSCSEFVETVACIDQLGRTIQISNCNAFNQQINISNFTPGVYLLKFYTERGVFTEPFVKQ